MRSPHLVCPCGLAVHPGTAGFHRPHCPLDDRTLEDRIAQAIGDPGSILDRRPDESVTRWATRSVLVVLDSETTLTRGLMFLDDAAGGDTIEDRHAGQVLRCQTRAANAQGVTFRCGSGAAHSRRCNFVAERVKPDTRPYAAPGMPDGALERAQGIAETMPTVGRWPGAEGGDVR